MVGAPRPVQTRSGRTAPHTDTGRDTVSGRHVDCVDDSAFHATGDVRDGVLQHEHLVLHREEQQT
ncbi:Atu4866 domain-containing protein [Streptomyces sp. NPDC048248]|uniref:Atu4866 domain-containing protein n=1 Tax=Streptomyces sp. NPDC048248 TaxID=3365523 RepID=UPI00371C1AA0